MDRCESCRRITACGICGGSVSRFDHVGVRASSGVGDAAQESGIWHYARPCGHKTHLPTSRAQAKVKYNGGPLWKNGYSWQNVYWGPYFEQTTASAWVARLEKATLDIESDQSYSGGLSQYNVSIGRVVPFTIIKTAPPTKLSDNQIKQALTNWISEGTVSKLGTRGGYNIFLPPGVTVSLSPQEQSCSAFCDYHNSAGGIKGPFYTVEPYPCAQGCNRCTSDPFDTLTQGLSEEMVELKTDMDPGTGWVIGNEELCDYCNRNFVCNRISTGEYVNSWYDKERGACWKSAGGLMNPSALSYETGSTRTRLSQ